jgi:hypothetical protein
MELPSEHEDAIKLLSSSPECSLTYIPLPYATLAKVSENLMNEQRTCFYDVMKGARAKKSILHPNMKLISFSLAALKALALLLFLSLSAPSSLSDWSLGIFIHELNSVEAHRMRAKSSDALLL